MKRRLLPALAALLLAAAFIVGIARLFEPTVDMPQPLSPTSPIISPDRRLKETLSTA